MSDKLTPKQESFCQAYIELGCASSAYRHAYNTGKMKPETVNRKAKVELDKGKIRARVAELQAAHRERHNVTVDSITAELEEARRLALSREQANAAVSASMGKAKVCGLLVDKIEAETTVNLAMSPEWQLLLTTILSALDPYPDARLAVAAAMAESEAPVVRH